MCDVCVCGRLYAARPNSAPRRLPGSLALSPRPFWAHVGGRVEVRSPASCLPHSVPLHVPAHQDGLLVRFAADRRVVAPWRSGGRR